ncbi:hypothetical protein [Streptomyces platensis]|uniref:hypothetical protein n=1 Tax=Streptomyces platensis TaxID=58346 RepID=UPI003F5E9B65
MARARAVVAGAGSARGSAGSPGPGGPARARTCAVNGRLPASAETSAICPVTAQRTRRVCCAAATRRAAAQATAGP